jgi:hypothetical protein
MIVLWLTDEHRSSFQWINHSIYRAIDETSRGRWTTMPSLTCLSIHLSVYPSVCCHQLHFLQWSMENMRCLLCALSKQTERGQSCYFSRPLICNKNKYVRSSLLLHLQIRRRRRSCSSIMSVHSTISSRDQMIEDLSIVLLTFNHIADVRAQIDKKASSNVVVVMHSRNRISISSEWIARGVPAIRCCLAVYTHIPGMLSIRRIRECVCGLTCVNRSFLADCQIISGESIDTEK